MPKEPTHPGVYVAEVPGGARQISGVATSVTAFIGRALRGPCNEPVPIRSYIDFVRKFGGLWADSMMSYAVQQFFQNGGTDALIIRVVHLRDATAANNAARATITTKLLELEAADEGNWGNKLRVWLDSGGSAPKNGKATGSRFSLRVEDTGTGEIEIFKNLSISASSPRYVKTILENESSLVRVRRFIPTADTHRTSAAGVPVVSGLVGNNYNKANRGGNDGAAITDVDITGLESAQTGIYSLEKTDLFNLMCIPPLTREADIAPGTYRAALDYCKKRRAVLVIDPPDGWRRIEKVKDGIEAIRLRDENAVMYFPRIKAPDKLNGDRLVAFAPCGAVAGIIARTDALRGVWKAPAGTDAILNGVPEMAVNLTDAENGRLNTLGVNCLRYFPGSGSVVWGARTLEGADNLGSEWKYLPVRRTALFIEESLYRGTQWVVFEPNGEPLWAQIRLNVSAFMHSLFLQGAFQGKAPKDAYFVKCDKETTPQSDIPNGVVNMLVGFAPLKPAEFIIIKLQQKAGNNGAGV
jgi:uncharacterized protein